MKKLVLVVLLAAMVGGVAVADEAEAWNLYSLDQKAAYIYGWCGGWADCNRVVNGVYAEGETYIINDFNSWFQYFATDPNKLLRLINFLDYYYSVPANSLNDLGRGITDCYLLEMEAQKKQ